MLAIVLVSALAISGCVKKDTTEPTPTTSTPTTSTTPTGTTPTSPTNGGNSTPPKPTTTAVVDKGAIQGQFEKAWTINVPVVSPASVTVLFNVTGAQAGAPATAAVYLVFTDPAGKVLKSATLGLGGDPGVKWSFTAADITSTGDYKLKATSQAATGPVPTGLPSGGVANYDLYAKVDY